jgi:dephospho-CoA kinase
METMERQWKTWQEREPHGLIIFDIPLIYEANLAHRFSTIILVYVPRGTQIHRLIERDGVSRSEAEKTLAMQLPIESKKEWADLIIDNSRDLDHTLQQVRAIWKALMTDHQAF